MEIVCCSTPPSTSSPIQPGSKVPLTDATHTVTPAGERDDKHEEIGAVTSKTKDPTPVRPRYRESSAKWLQFIYQGIERARQTKV